MKTKLSFKNTEISPASISIITFSNSGANTPLPSQPNSPPCLQNQDLQNNSLAKSEKSSPSIILDLIF